MSNRQLRADDYAASREKFLTACQAAGAQLAQWKNPEKSPTGEALYTDVAWLGAQDAEHVVVMMSGTHGLEGFCGSACQTAWLQSAEAAQLPEHVAVLLIHAINPYGFAWMQRETEEGVDLNRNFIDHQKPYPERPLYEQIHDALTCPELEGPRHDDAQRTIDTFCSENGRMALLQAVMSGQYSHPRGFNYGGAGPVWSHQTFVAILQQYCQAARHVVLLDYHTGLGPFGHASLVVFEVPETEAALRLADWFGPSIWAVGSSDPDAAFSAGVSQGCSLALPHARVSCVTVEFGTYDVEREIEVIRRDFWKRHYGQRNSELGKSITAEILEYFNPADPDWHALVLFRSGQIVRRAILGVAAHAT